MLLRFLPLLTGVLPVIAIHTALIVAIDAGSVPSCIPYLEGCTSISAAGRYLPAIYVFKPAMSVEAVLMTAYWLYSAAWIAALAAPAGNPRTTPWPMAASGVGGALALILYVTFLGSQEPFYEFMRRFGIYFYFLLTIVAQLLLARHTIKLASVLELPRVLSIARLQLLLAGIPFALGALNFLLKSVMTDASSAENIIEWIVALIMHCYFIASYFAWRTSNFRQKFQVSGD